MLATLSLAALLASSLVNAAPAYVHVRSHICTNLTFASLTERGVNFNWGGEKVRGVNIG